MLLTPLQKAAALSFVSLFETGKISDPSRYSIIANIPGDTGGLSYGKHQVTLNSGHLYFLIDSFCQKSVSADDNTLLHTYANQFEPYLPLLRNRDDRLNSDASFADLLRLAGELPEMQQTQDEYFEKAFWYPCMAKCDAFGFVYPLSAAVIYDSFIQGAWDICERLTTGQFGNPNAAREIMWVSYYVGVRSHWLSTNRNMLLRQSVYRPKSLQEICYAQNWNLALPFIVRGVQVNESDLFNTLEPDANSSIPTYHANAHDDMPVLFEGSTHSNEQNYKNKVILVQKALRVFGFYDVPLDGIYGPITSAYVGKFQTAHGLVSDEEVGPRTYALLGV